MPFVTLQNNLLVYPTYTTPERYVEAKSTEVSSAEPKPINPGNEPRSKQTNKSHTETKKTKSRLPNKASETTAGSADDPQATRVGNSRAVSRDGIRQPIARRVPSDVRDTGVGASTRRDGVDDFTGLGVEDIKTIAATAGLVAGTADISSVETPAEATNCTAEVAKQGTLAEKVVGVPEGDECITTANCEVPAVWSEFDAEAGGGVSFDGVVDVEGGVGHVSHATVARSRKEMDIGGLRGAHVVSEGSSVGLDVLRAAFESFVGG